MDNYTKYEYESNILKTRFGIEPDPNNDYYQFIYQIISSSTWQCEDNEIVAAKYINGLKNDSIKLKIAEMISHLIFNGKTYFEYKGHMPSKLLMKFYNDNEIKQHLIDAIVFNGDKDKIGEKLDIYMEQMCQTSNEMINIPMNSYYNFVKLMKND